MRSTLNRCDRFSNPVLVVAGLLLAAAGALGGDPGLPPTVVTLATIAAGYSVSDDPLVDTSTIVTIEGKRIVGRIRKMQAGKLILLPSPDNDQPQQAEAQTIDLNDIDHILLGQALPTASLVGYWRLDGKDGQEVIDSSGINHHGQLRSARRYTGKFKGGLRFDGRSDWVQLPTAMVSSSSGTVAMWINSSYRHRDDGMLFYGGGQEGGDKGYGKNQLHLAVNKSGKLVFYAWGGQEQSTRITTDRRVTVGRWLHVAASWHADGKAVIYIDGKRVAGGKYHAASFQLDQVIRLGSAATDRGRQFNGIMDEVRLYRDPLAPGQIKQLANYVPRDDDKRQASTWQVNLVGRDLLYGDLGQWTEDRIELKLTAPGKDGQVVTLDLPMAKVRQVWHTETNEIDRARSFAVTAEDQDVAYVLTKGVLRTVKGKCLGVRDGSLRFVFVNKERKVSLDRVVGVKFASQGRPKPPAVFHQTLGLIDGGRISGTWLGPSPDPLTDKTIGLKTFWNKQIHLPRDLVVRISFKNGRMVYLSDLEPQEVEEVPFFDRVMRYRRDQSLTGKALKLSDGEYEKGIAVHSRSVLHYDIGGAFNLLRCKVGFQQPEGVMGEATVRVLGDGKTLFELPDARGDQPPTVLELDIAGIKRLSLEVDFGQGQDVADRVVWANARLIRKAASN